MRSSATRWSDGVAWLTIDRPEARNALNAEPCATACSPACAASTPTTTPRCWCSPAPATRPSAPAATSRRWPTTALTVPPPDFLPQFGRNIEVDQADHRRGQRRRLRRRLPAGAEVRPGRRRRARAVRRSPRSRSAAARRGRRRCRGWSRRGSPWRSCSPATRSTRAARLRGRLVNRGRARRRAARAPPRRWPSGSPANAPLSVRAAQGDRRTAAREHAAGRGLRRGRADLGAGLPQRRRPGGPARPSATSARPVWKGR